MFDIHSSFLDRSTTHIYRPFGGVADIRELVDKSARITVVTFPIAMLDRIVPAQANFCACYVLADDEKIYFGETNNLGRRLGEHAADPKKSFAREIHVIRAVPGFALTKESVGYLEYHLTLAAEQAGLMKVVKASPPRLPAYDPLDEPSLERLLSDAQRLLFDAGLRAYASACAGTDTDLDGDPETDTAEAESSEPASSFGRETADGEDTAGHMEIGVDLPRDATEYELIYADSIWARGYDDAKGFVVAAGSDFRKMTNASAQNPIRVRRHELLAAPGVLTVVPGATDRLRLMAEVRFSSRAIAAKVICGAHVDSSKWRPRNMAELPVLSI